MSISEKLAQPSGSADTLRSASDDHAVAYINTILALEKWVHPALSPQESEEWHGERRSEMVRQASHFFEQALYLDALSELNAIKRDYEIAQGPTFLPDLDAAIALCRQLSVKKIATTLIAESLDKAAS